MAGKHPSGRVVGSFYATGYEPKVIRKMATAGYEVNQSMFAARELKSGKLDKTGTDETN